MSGAPMYIGQSRISYRRIFEHIGAAYGVGVNEQLYPTATPATSNPSEVIRQLGVSNCIYGAYDDTNNFYGLGFDTLNQFRAEGWIIQPKDYLNFAEICHILVRNMNPSNALTNKTIGGETSTFVYTIQSKVQPILDKYQLSVKDFGQVMVHFPSDPDYAWKILYPQEYGAYRLLCEVVSKKVLSTENWPYLIEGALRSSNARNFLQNYLFNIFQKTAQECTTLIRTQNSGSTSRLQFTVNKGLVDTLAETLMNYIEGRLYYDAVYKAADIALKARYIGYNINIKVKSGQEKLIKDAVKKIKIPRADILTTVKNDQQNQQKPQWFITAQSMLGGGPPLNSLNSSFLRLNISFLMMNIFKYYAEREIKNAPVFGRSAPAADAISFTNSNTANLSQIPQSDWLKNRMYRVYSGILGGGASTLQYWDRAYEQYASYTFGSNLTEINTLTLTAETWMEDGGYIEKKPMTSSWVVAANINYANDPDKRFLYHFTPAQWSRIQQKSKISTNQINWNYL